MNNLRLITPCWDAPPCVGAITTTRYGGESVTPYGDGAGGGGLNLALHVGDSLQSVERNRATLGAQLPARALWLSQVHGTVVVDAVEAVQNTTADASLTVDSGVACAIMTADCLPVLLCDRQGNVVGAAHAGWRGLARGVLENIVKRMRDRGAGELIAWLGPAIGPEKFEVGEDVVAAFADNSGQASEAFRPASGGNGKYFADLYALARLRLESVGVRDVFGGEFCTFSESRFFSYRRDGVTGRMASMIWINKG